MVVRRDSPAAEGGTQRRDRIRIVSVVDVVADIALDSDVAVDRGSRRNVLALRLGDIDIFQSSFVCGGRVDTVVVVAVVTVVVVIVVFVLV